MIKVCFADNYPVVHFGVKSYFTDNSDIDIVSIVSHFEKVKEVLDNKDINVLVLDLDLAGLASMSDLKAVIKNYPSVKVIVYSGFSEQGYAANAIKAGVAGYIPKTSKLENLAAAIIKVHQGEILMNETIMKKLALIAKQNKVDRLYQKLSNRELEVLRYLSGGKKNKEVATILNLSEKTISTYKLRLLQKLNVTNLVDLINKAKTLQIV